MPNKTLWSHLISHHELSVCERLDQLIPTIPRRSPFYCLSPMNVGSPACESVTSYFLRLAQAHCVTPRRLFDKALNLALQKDVQNTRGLVGPSDTLGTWQINGNGLVAEKWVKALEAITLQQGLNALTLLPFRQAFSKRDACRRERAWCPLCLYEQEQSNGIIYEQLLWTLKSVTACSVHMLPLQTKCPHCQRTCSPLSGTMRPGKCGACNGWLGASSGRDHNELDGANDESTEYQIFIANEVGQLIAVSLEIKDKFNKEISKTAISKFVERCLDGNTRALTRYLGLNRGADFALTTKRQRCFVGLSLLLKLAFVSQTHLLDLLTNEDALAKFSPSISTVSRPSPLIAANKEMVLSALAAAVHEIPPPSLEEVGVRVGRTSSRLRQHSAETCKQIIKNYRMSERGRKALTWQGGRVRTSSEIEAAFKIALITDPPPTLNQVAQSLGYRNRFGLKYRVPELCRALLEKHPKPYEARKKFVESELRKSLETDPPEALLTVARRLGYVSAHILRLRYKEFSRRIQSRYEAHKKALLLSEICAQLNAALSETPPPTLKNTTRKLGVSDKWLRDYFPEERRLIVARYLSYRQEQSVANQTSDKERIRAIVRDFHKSGTFPSMNAVLDVFSASALKRTEVWATIKRAREELVTD
ncbi:MAG: hypothetical protein QOE96_3271 [Blastocatellia bacterium]|nr:hypothetical protein [Blastocatellia bacterium]